MIAYRIQRFLSELSDLKRKANESQTNRASADLAHQKQTSTMLNFVEALEKVTT